MLEKLKNYYRNSPKRIGLTIVGVHIFFLTVAIVRLALDNTITVSIITLPLLAGVGAWFFPIFVFSWIADFFHLPWRVGNVLTVLYYILFMLLCYFAKHTASKHFIIVSLIFCLWFCASLFIGLSSVFMGNLF